MKVGMIGRAGAFGLALVLLAGCARGQDERRLDGAQLRDAFRQAGIPLERIAPDDRALAANRHLGGIPGGLTDVLSNAPIRRDVAPEDTPDGVFVALAVFEDRPALVAAARDYADQLSVRAELFSTQANVIAICSAPAHRTCATVRSALGDPDRLLDELGVRDLGAIRERLRR